MSASGTKPTSPGHGEMSASRGRLCGNHSARRLCARLIRLDRSSRMKDWPRPQLRFSCCVPTTAFSVFTQPQGGSGHGNIETAPAFTPYPRSSPGRSPRSRSAVCVASSTSFTSASTPKRSTPITAALTASATDVACHCPPRGVGTGASQTSWQIVWDYSRSDRPGVMSKTSRSSRSTGSALLFRPISISASR